MRIVLSYLALAAAAFGSSVVFILGQPLWIALVFGLVAGQVITLLLFEAFLLRVERDRDAQHDKLR